MSFGSSGSARGFAYSKSSTGPGVGARILLAIATSDLALPVPEPADGPIADRERFDDEDERVASR
jgi:hypothetical protein